MTKTSILAITALLCLNLYAQEKDKADFKQNKFSLGLGGVLTSFQDVKFSKVHYKGTGTNLSFGYENIGKNYFSTNLNLIYAVENPKTHNSGTTQVYNGIIDVSYLKPIYKKENQKLYLGAKWDVLDFYVRNTEALDNNSIYYISGSNLKLSSLYERTISNKINLRTGLNFQLASFMKESTSFSFSAPQTPLENGEFSYQNDKLENPFGFKYYNFEPFTKYLNIETLVEVHYKRRWMFSYKWNVQRSNKVNNYPMTRGYSSLSVKYNF